MSYTVVSRDSTVVFALYQIRWKLIDDWTVGKNRLRFPAPGRDPLTIFEDDSKFGNQYKHITDNIVSTKY